MKTLSFRKNNNNSLYFHVLNAIIQPLGVYFEPNDVIKAVYIFNCNRKSIGKIEFKDFIQNETNEFIIDENRSFSISFDQINLLTNIIINDQINGKTTINFKHSNGPYAPTSDGDIILYPPFLEITKASICMSSLDNSSYYTIDYDQNTDDISFKRSDINGFISISRNEAPLTKISFNKAEQDYVRSISSTGDETLHKASSMFSFMEEPYEVIFEEKNLKNGYKNTIDKSQDLKFRHFSNTKIINNANVRDFIDDIMDEYEKRLPYGSSKDGILGGYLFSEYLKGEANTRTIGNNFMEEVGLPVKSKANQRNRSSKKQSK